MTDRFTTGPWTVFYYDAGDRYYDRDGPCPSIQAPPEEDCAIVHWDGFKQSYWKSANSQEEIEANAQLMACAPEMLYALREMIRVSGELSPEQQIAYDNAKMVVEKAVTVKPPWT